ncbi:GntR family transcriptional regulator [Actinomadura macra]|uniref:GntR family transcriptional regulator n=1 Tax=Actinomadura macra TaxID=46164 RepID=UPI000B324404|nr:GntR family transcriptional regulator [Actinomadura macra]
MKSGLDGIAQMQYSSKSDIVCAVLRELIISGEFKADEPLRQRDLAQRFGFSQTPVREALRRLESEGLVNNDPHRGATVAGSRGSPLEDNFQIRAALEPLGAKLAATAISDDTIAQLRRINEEIRRLAEDDPAYAALNREFHFTIYEAAQSPVLMSMMGLLWQAMPNGPRVKRSRRESVEQHDRLIDALAKHDKQLASDLTYEHIMGSAPVENG